MGNKLEKRIINAAGDEAPALDLTGVKIGGKANSKKKPIPDNVRFALTRFTKLVLSGTSLTALPHDLQPFEHKLVALHLDGNKLHTIPDSICYVTNLVSLNLCENKLTELPAGVCDLSLLRVLILHKNGLRVLPENLGQLKRLTSVYAGNNKLSKLPGTLWECSALEQLHVQQNQLEELPRGLDKATKLVVLNARTNRICHLSDEIGMCRDLERLELWDNKLEALPDALGECSSLQFLTLHKNAIRELPFTLGKLQATSLTVKGNPLQGHFKKLRNASTEKILEYLRTIDGGATPAFFSTIGADHLYDDVTGPGADEGGGGGPEETPNLHNEAYQLMKSAVEALRWIRHVLGNDAIPERLGAAKGTSYLYEPTYLMDGVVLCKVANVIKAGSIKVHVAKKGGVVSSSEVKKNALNFLSFCRGIGLSNNALFAVEDLTQYRNMELVFRTVHEVAAAAQRDPSCKLVKLTHLVNFRFRAEHIALAASIIQAKDGIKPLPAPPAPATTEVATEAANKPVRPLLPRNPNRTHTILDYAEATGGADRRDLSIREIILTEVAYARTLDVIVNHFKNPLNSPGLLSSDECDIAFSNVEKLRAFHREIADELTARLQKVEESTERAQPGDRIPRLVVTDCFLKRSTQFAKLYVEYCSNHPRSLAMIEAKAAEVVAVSLFLEDAVHLPECEQLRLQDFLLTPVQRMCKYPLLFKELLKLTRDTHPCVHIIEDSLIMMSALCDYVNAEARRVQWSDERLGIILPKIDRYDEVPDPPPGVERELLCEDTVMKLSSGKKQERTFFLFTDVLVYAKAHSKKGKVVKYELCDAVHLNELIAHDLKDAAASKKYETVLSIKLHRVDRKNKSYIVSFDSGTDKAAWLCEFGRAKAVLSKLKEDGDFNVARPMRVPRPPTETILAKKQQVSFPPSAHSVVYSGMPKGMETWSDDGDVAWEQASADFTTSIHGAMACNSDASSLSLAHMDARCVVLEEEVSAHTWGHIMRGSFNGTPVGVYHVSAAPQLAPALPEEELARLKAAVHPNLIRVIGSFSVQDPQTDGWPLASGFALVTMAIEGVPLREVLLSDGDAMDLTVIVKFAKDIVRAMSFLHRVDMVHGMLTSELVRVDTRRAKAVIGGFAVEVLRERSAQAAEASGAGAHARLADEPWRAPELVGVGDLTFSADVYAFALILIDMASCCQVDRHFFTRTSSSPKNPPFETDPIVEYFRADWPTVLSELAWTCAASAPSFRPTMDDLSVHLDSLDIGATGDDVAEALGQAINTMARTTLQPPVEAIEDPVPLLPAPMGDDSGEFRLRTWSAGAHTREQERQQRMSMLFEVDELLDGMYYETPAWAEEAAAWDASPPVPPRAAPPAPAPRAEV